MNEKQVLNKVFTVAKKHGYSFAISDNSYTFRSPVGEANIIVIYDECGYAIDVTVAYSKVPSNHVRLIDDIKRFTTVVERMAESIRK